MEIAHARPSGFALALRPLRDMLVFSGRSPRTEVVYFFIAGVLANMITITITGPAAPLLDTAKLAWAFLWAFPWIALFVRRLHDQGRSGGLAAGYLVATYLVLPLLAWSFVGEPQPMDIHSAHLGALSWHYPTMRPMTAIVFAIAGAVSILQLILFLLPGTDGSNRYGPDPRGPSLA